MSSLQTGFRSAYFGALAIAFSPVFLVGRVPQPISRLFPITLGSRPAAERVDPELGGSCGNGETLRSLRKILVVLEDICGGAVVAPRRRHGPVLLWINIYRACR